MGSWGKDEFERQIQGDGIDGHAWFRGIFTKKKKKKKKKSES